MAVAPLLAAVGVVAPDAFAQPPTDMAVQASPSLLGLLLSAMNRVVAALWPIAQALPHVPGEIARAWSAFGQRPGDFLPPGTAATTAVVLTVVGAAYLARQAMGARLRPMQASNVASQLSRRFVIDVVGLLVAALVATVGAELFVRDTGLAPNLMRAIVDFTLLVMAALLVPAILFRPGEPQLRLAEARDPGVASATLPGLAAIFLGIAFPTLIPVFLEAGMAWPAAQALALVVGFAVAAFGSVAGLRLVGGERRSPRWRAMILAAAAAFWLAWSYGVVALDFDFYFTTIRLGAVLTLGFVLDRLILRLGSTAFKETASEQVAEDPAAEMAPDFWPNHGRAVRRVLWFAVASTAVVILIAWVARVLPDGVVAPGDRPIEWRVAQALLTLNVGYAVFVALSVWTRSRFLSELAVQSPSTEDEEIAPASRLATIMPIVQGLIGAFVLGAATLSALSRLGVDITPILAGAGILGLAISFGSQSLVRDVVAGIFYMADDAFRHGEYIEAAKLKGNVERISIRSVQLRHHNGQLHTVPFGQLGSITNYSRDWVTLKFNLRLSRDIDIDRVRKLVKVIGNEMLEDPEIGKEFILPLKMQGVADILENALVVRFKFTAKPGKPTYLQREAIKRMIRAFEAEGIAFARNTVVVQTTSDREKPDEAGAAAASLGA